MTQRTGYFDDFGMDTITLAGELSAKLAAMREAGFSQVMLKANDIVGHPGGVPAAVRVVRDSGLRVTGFQVLRDFEGLSGHLHDYKVDIAKGMLEMAHALGAPLLLCCSSTSQHASSIAGASSITAPIGPKRGSTSNSRTTPSTKPTARTMAK